MKLESKQDFTDLMLQLLNPLKAWYTPEKAGLKLGGAGVIYNEKTVQMEGFSRPLWGLWPFWAGGGKEKEFEEIYRQGFAAGTNPQNSEYWGECHDYDQLFVEMAAIACSLVFAPDAVYNRLEKAEKENLSAWLGQINEHEIPQCNWQFFRVLVNIALHKIGVGADKKMLEYSLNEIESYYLGDGWYSDGSSRQKDYYISFAMHYYGLLYAVAMEQEDPARSGEFKKRAEIFAQDFIYWFDDTGAALPFGRSLTYRFAQVSFWSACIVADIRPLPLATMKGLIVRHLNWWLNTDMLDRDGILTVGYGYPNLIMAERYNSPGSPYWGMKTFLILALPDEHEFWKITDEPLPVLPAVHALNHADMLMHHRAGNTTAYTPGSCELYGHGHVVEKYSKFAYSSKFAFCVARSQYTIEEAAPDCMLAFIPDGDSLVYVRRNSTDFEIHPDSVASRWSPIEGITVETTIIPTGKGHRRLHKIKSQIACMVYDCGYAVPSYAAQVSQYTKADTARINSAKGNCLVSGKGPAAEGVIINADPNCHLLYRNVRIPAVRYHIEPGTVQIETTIEDS